MKMPLGKEVGLGPGHIVLDGNPVGTSAPTAAPSHFSAHVYCTQTVAHLSNCWALVNLILLFFAFCGTKCLCAVTFYLFRRQFKSVNHSFIDWDVAAWQPHWTFKIIYWRLVKPKQTEEF